MSLILEERFQGLLLIEGSNFSDDRGSIEKPLWNSVIPDFQVDEAYFIRSKKDVLRGMHYQIPPFSQGKFLFVAKGKILDVVLDLRKDSPTFGKSTSFILQEGVSQGLFVPPGIAHGYLTLEEDSLINYIQSGKYSPAFERGVRYNSFGFDWEIANPILSHKDANSALFDERTVL